VGPAESHEITALLMAWRSGDHAALELLIPLVERELRQIARAYLGRERPDPNVQTTVMINEVFVRLMGSDSLYFRDRSHFFALCARVMRRVLVDQARARRAGKRGSNSIRHVTLDESCLVCPDRLTDIVAIDEALILLSREDPRKGRVVELRFFGGFSVEETAEVLGVSPESVLRDWRLAKVWLLRVLGGTPKKHRAPS
jgi:RNA polymerase sigma factor (TIGR02999 family)